MNKHFGSRPIPYLICGKNIHDTGDFSVHQSSAPGSWAIQIQTQYRFNQRDPKRAEMLGALGVWKHFGFGGSSREFVSCKVWEVKGLGKEAIAALAFDLFCWDLIDIWLSPILNKSGPLRDLFVRKIPDLYWTLFQRLWRTEARVHPFLQTLGNMAREREREWANRFCEDWNRTFSKMLCLGQVIGYLKLAWFGYLNPVIGVILSEVEVSESLVKSNPNGPMNGS